MVKPFRPRRDFAGMEARRRAAAKLFSGGKLTQAEVARKLGVTRTSVHRWFHAWRKGGVTRLRGAGRAGRKPRLEAPDLQRLDKVLRAGARHHGFPTEIWTLPRVATVIQRTTGIEYHPGHVWKLLRNLGWSLQRPARQAKERDDEAIRIWVAKDWPRVKKTPGAARPGSCSPTRAG